MTDPSRPPGIAALYRALWRHAGRRRLLAAAMALLVLAATVRVAIP